MSAAHICQSIRSKVIQGHSISQPAVSYRRFLAHGKKRRRYNLRREDEQLLAAIENQPPAPPPPNWQEAMGWKPLLFIGVAPLVAWGILCLVRPTLREQMFASMGYETSTKKNYVRAASADPVDAVAPESKQS